MQPQITAKCQRAPLLPVRDELLLRRYFILNASCLNWSMHLGKVAFFGPICLLPPPPLAQGAALLPLSFHGARGGGPSPLSASPHPFPPHQLTSWQKNKAQAAAQAPYSAPSTGGVPRALATPHPHPSCWLHSGPTQTLWPREELSAERGEGH